MKKIKVSKQKTSTKNFKTKNFKKGRPLLRNPWIGDDGIEKALNKLIGEHVILQTASWVYKRRTPESVSTPILVPRNFYGILKNSKYEDRYNNPYIFQFNPLNQWKYGGIDPNSRGFLPQTVGEMNEDNMIMELESRMGTEADINDRPTFEWEFNVKQVWEIDDAKIQLYNDSKGHSPIFQPKPIPDFGVWGL